jgi:hypothetical protein
VQIDTVNNEDTKYKLAQSKWAPSVLPSTGIIKLQMNKNDIPGLTSSLIQMGVGILSIQPRHSLEDYFLSLTTQQENYVDLTEN